MQVTMQVFAANRQTWEFVREIRLLIPIHSEQVPGETRSLGVKGLPFLILCWTAGGDRKQTKHGTFGWVPEKVFFVSFCWCSQGGAGSCFKSAKNFKMCFLEHGPLRTGSGEERFWATLPFSPMPCTLSHFRSFPATDPPPHDVPRTHLRLDGSSWLLQCL